MNRSLPRAPEGSAGPTILSPTIENLNWDITPLGPIERWSEPMWAAVELLRLSPAPMVSFWGLRRDRDLQSGLHGPGA